MESRGVSPGGWSRGFGVGGGVGVEGVESGGLRSGLGGVESGGGL